MTPWAVEGARTIKRQKVMRASFFYWECVNFLPVINEAEKRNEAAASIRRERPRGVTGYDCYRRHAAGSSILNAFDA